MPDEFTRADAERLVALVLTEGFGSVRAYCAARGLIYSTLMWRAHRAGHNLGTMLRNEKLRLVMERPAGTSVARAVLDLAHYASPQSFYRARRQQLGIDHDHHPHALRAAQP